MKRLLLKSTLAFFLIAVFGFSIPETCYQNFCGPAYYADNSNSTMAPEMNNITISNSTGSQTYYVCCGNDGFLDEWGGGGTFTIVVVVESDWGGGSASIGIRIVGGSVVQCQQYNYGQGTYTFYVSNSCYALEIFTTPGISC